MIEIYLDVSLKAKSIANNRITEFIRFFLDIAEPLEFEEMYSFIFPEFLLSNEDRCRKVVNELLICTKDKFVHQLSPLQEYVLFHILRFFIDAHDEEELIRSDYEGEEELTEEEWLMKHLDDIDVYLDVCFEDWDFYDVPALFYLFESDPINFESIWHTNLDYYLELMPDDIKERYLEIRNNYIKQIAKNSVEIEKEDDLLKHVENAIKRFRHSIMEKRMHKLLWNDDKTHKDEKSAQKCFELSCYEYCERYNIDITPEAETGRGPVDFKFSYGNSLKTIVEVKLSSNSNLEHGLEIQTVQYMISEKISIAFFLVIIFDNKDFEKLQKLKDITDEIYKKYNLTVILSTIDATLNKLSASNLSKSKIFDTY